MPTPLSIEANHPEPTEDATADATARRRRRTRVYAPLVAAVGLILLLTAVGATIEIMSGVPAAAPIAPQTMDAAAP